MVLTHRRGTAVRSGTLSRVSDGAAGGRGVYSIGAVARMLGIPVATIRNWEERYATVIPERSAGGRRLYSRGQVERLRYVASQVGHGRVMISRTPSVTF